MKIFRNLWMKNRSVYRTKGGTEFSNEPVSGYKVHWISPNGITITHPLGCQINISHYNFKNIMDNHTIKNGEIDGLLVIAEEYSSFYLLSVNDEKYQEALLQLEMNELREKVKPTQMERNKFYQVKYNRFEKDLLFVGEMFIYYKSRPPLLRVAMNRESNDILKEIKKYAFYEPSENVLYLSDKVPSKIFSSDKISPYISSNELINDINERKNLSSFYTDNVSLGRYNSIGRNNLQKISLVKIQTEILKDMFPGFNSYPE